VALDERDGVAYDGGVVAGGGAANQAMPASWCPWSCRNTALHCIHLGEGSKCPVQDHAHAPVVTTVTALRPVTTAFAAVIVAVWRARCP
jgi:hypothetical protein